VLLAFRSEEEREMMISEHVRSRSDIELGPEFYDRLHQIRERGYEMMASAQTSGVYNLSAPVLGPDRRCIAALTCPFIALVNAPSAPDITQAITLVQKTAAQLSLLAGADVVHPA
jgi:DNA-binding IclR family transcriptional regulator